MPWLDHHVANASPNYNLIQNVNDPFRPRHGVALRSPTMGDVGSCHGMTHY